MRRRKFLALLARASAGGLLLGGCSEDLEELLEESLAGSSGRGGLSQSELASLISERSASAGGAPSATSASLVGGTGSTSGGGVSSTASGGASLPGSGSPVLINRGPWVQVTGTGRMRLRFESLDERPVEAEWVGAGVDELLRSSVSGEQVDLSWPPGFLLDRSDHPDLPGFYSLHDFEVSGLRRGEEVRWSVAREGELISGRFMTPHPKDAEFTLAWISDTMMPASADVAEVIAAKDFDLVIHGGDIQYQTNPFDTWAGFFAAWQPLLQKAPVHFVIGNHEYEEFDGVDEFEQIYMRFFEGQGEVHPGIDYHALTWGRVRFLLLNSEVDFREADGAQFRWAEQELISAALDPGIDVVIPAFHRPYFTFSRSRPNLQARELWHDLFRAYDVPVVLTGHNHCYERFEKDGIVYIMDGGGGALRYDPDDNIDDVEDDPGVSIEDRKFASRTYGATLLHVRADGTLEGERFTSSGDLIDTWSAG